MSLYSTILTVCFIVPNTPREVIGMFYKYERYVNKLVSDAIKNGHLEEVSVVYKKDKQRCIDRLLITTVQGIEYLKNTQNNNWLNYIELNNLKNDGVVFYDDKKNLKLRRYVQIAESKIVSEIAGANTTLLMSPLYNQKYDNQEEIYQKYFLTEENETVKKSYRNLIVAAIKKAGSDDLQENIIDITKTDIDNNESFIRFTDIKQIKAVLGIVGHAQEASRDYDRCSCTGIIESKKKCLLTYSCQQIGMSWNKWNIKADINLFGLWFNNKSITDYRQRYKNKESGVLFIKNARHLKMLIDDTAKARNGKELGEGFEHLYIIPKTFEGGKHLNWIMVEDDEMIEKMYTEFAIKYLGHKLNTDSWKELFHLIHDDNYVFIGTVFDLVKINDLRGRLNFIPGEVEIICTTWQVAYYKAIFPDLTITEIE